MSEPFIGQIEIFAGNFAPRGWAFCHGQLLQIASNTALFSLLGTIYGGDGRTNFALPDLRGRAPVGPGNGPGLSNRSLGQRGGAETVTLTTAQMPYHNHGVTHSPGTLGAQTGDGDQHEPSSTAVLATPTVQNTPGLNTYSTQAPDTDIEGADVSGNLVLNNTGGGQPHTNLMPLMAMNYIIALQGVYPSRD